MNDDATTQLDRADRMVNAMQHQTGGPMSKQQLLGAQRRNARTMRVTVVVVALISLLALVGCAVLATRIAQLESANTLREASIRVLEQANVDRQIAGLPPIPVPSRDSTEPIPSGPEVDLRALSDAAAAVVLREIRLDPSFRGSAGVDGVPGAPCDPTVNATCVGPKGADSVVPGPAGPPPSCEANLPNGCRGDQGTQGDRGPAGADAPRPTSARFERPANGSRTSCDYVTVYSDGTELRAPTSTGMCA